MKKILLASVILFCINANYGQNLWTKKADFGGGIRRHAVGFNIGKKGYVGTGYDNNINYHNDFWEYDPATDTWTQKANFGGVGRFGAVGFSIGSRGYIGTGIDANDNLKKDFWEYDPVKNKWTRKANFGGTARWDASGFAIGSKGYIGTGRDLNPNADTRDFWEYNPATDKWTRKSDFGGDIRSRATAFGIANKGYLGIGVWVNLDRDEYDDKNDFWEYNPSTDAWTRKANFAGGDWFDATGFSIGGKGYIGTGVDGNDNSRNAFWEYDPVTNKWTRRANVGGGTTSAAASFSAGGKGYIVSGDGIKKNLWQYSPGQMVADAQMVTSDASNFTTGLSCYPNPSHGDVTVQYSVSTPQKVSLTVRDIKGRIVFNETAQAQKGINTYHLNLNNFSSGTYFLQLENSNEQKMIKLVINK